MPEKLENVIAHGNRGHVGHVDSTILCADGFKLSVVAGGGTYCHPRPDLCGPGRCPSGPDTYISNVRCDWPGPYSHVEVGYPSERPEPWHCTGWAEGYDDHSDHEKCDGWDKFAESSEDPCGTVYGYVPVDMVRALVAAHGGEA